MRFASAKTGLTFTPFQPSGGGGAGIGQAGGMSTAAASFGAIRSKAPKYGNIGKTSIAAKGLKPRSVMKANSSMFQQGAISGARVKASEIQAEGIKKAAAEQKRGAMTSSIIGAVGSIGIGLLSDQTTKNTLTELNDGLLLLRKLRPVRFFYNEEYTNDPWRSHYGFVAQEYGQVMPDQVHLDKDLNKLTIDTNELIAVLVKSIQQLEQRLEVLER